MLQDKSFYLYRKEFPHAGNTWLTLYASSNENSISEHKLDEIVHAQISSQPYGATPSICRIIILLLL